MGKSLYPVCDTTVIGRHMFKRTLLWHLKLSCIVSLRFCFPCCWLFSTFLLQIYHQSRKVDCCWTRLQTISSCFASEEAGGCKKRKAKNGAVKKNPHIHDVHPSQICKAFGHWWGHQPSQGEVGGWHICSCERVYFLHRTSATPFARPHCGAHSHIFPHHKQKPGFAFCQVLSINIDYPWLFFVCNLFMFLQQSIIKVIGLQPSAGEISRRALKSDVTHGWLKLAGIFEQLLGGSEATRRAAVYLRGLARDELPIHPLHPLNWHENVNFLADLIPHEKAEPHACVLAVLCPSVPLRVVWKRSLRWFLRID